MVKMYKGKTILALIAARGGSKNLLRKNIKPLLGKPLIAWTIEQALASKYIDKLIVNTDDEEIAGISRKYGAEVPFLRPKKLASDESPLYETILHAIDFFEKQNMPYDILLKLECTSPMRYKNDINNVVRLLVNKNPWSVVGTCQTTNDHPLWAFKLENGYLVKFVSESANYKNLNRQQLSRAFLPYSIYATWWQHFKKYKTFYQHRTIPYLLKREQKVDIDDEVDFYIAECILKKYLGNCNGTF